MNKQTEEEVFAANKVHRNAGLEAAAVVSDEQKARVSAERKVDPTNVNLRALEVEHELVARMVRDLKDKS